GGTFTTVSGATRPRLARLQPDGDLDGFTVAVSDAVREILVQPDEKIVIAGAFTTVAGEAVNYLARLHADGTLDATLDPDVTGTGILAIAVHISDEIYIGGNFTQIDGETRDEIGSLQPDGRLGRFHA